jgi:hypothetical protein
LDQDILENIAMNWQGKWIWLKNETDSNFNLQTISRKTFNVKADGVDAAELFITADTQYRLFINGRWVSDGPERMFPWKYAYDRLDVSGYLQPGKNVIAVMVLHHGEGTFQSLEVRPGLLVQMEVVCGKSRQMICSDESWKMIIDPSHIRWTPRISCQMPCEEQVDARCLSADWLQVDFDDSKWQNTAVVSTVKDGPWKNLTERDIPLLDYERILPKRIVSMRAVKAANFVEGLNVKRALWPERVDANHRYYCGAVLSNLWSAAAQKVKLFPSPRGIVMDKVFLNGKKIDVLNGQEVSLKKGENILLAIFDFDCHFDDFTLVMEVKKIVILKSPVCKGKWAVAGPFENGGEDWDRLRNAKTMDDLKKGNLLKYFCEPAFTSAIGSEVHGLAINQAALPAAVKTKDIENLLTDNQELAVVEAHNHDVEILIDFGCEYNAHVELELEAADGVEIDAQCFEALTDGKPQYTIGNRSGFRYITRSGFQKFTTFRHFGFRYMTLTLRHLSAKVKIRNIRAIFVHHQVEHQGQFLCSDYLLNRIWETGKQTLLCCMEDTFTDCPTYEQTCWVGDARNESLVCHTTFGQYAMTRRCANLIADSLERSDLVESQVPSAWQNIIPVWSFLWAQMSWEHYYYSGEQVSLKSLYAAVKKMLKTIQSKYLDAGTGLFSIGGDSSLIWQFFDWTPIDAGHKLVTFNNMFLVSNLQVADRMATALGLKTEAVGWRKWKAELVANINKHLWCEKCGGYIDSIHNDGSPSTTISRPTNTLALLYDVVPANREKKILPIILGEKTKDIVPFGSPFALFFLLETLVKMGRFNDLASLVRREWGDMLDKGATTFWEQLGSTRSHCHAWSAAPTYFLSRYVLGVHPTSAGFKGVCFEPYLLDLTFAKGIMPTPLGAIKVQWTRSKSEFVFTIEKPTSVKSTLRLPAELKIASLKVNGRTVPGGAKNELALPACAAVQIVATLKK